MGDDALARAKYLLGTLEVAQRLGIWEWVPATDEMVWSDGLYDLLEIAPRVPPTMENLLTTLAPADRPAFVGYLSRARRERGMLAFRCQSERRRILQVRMQRTTTDDGTLRSIVGTSQDVTDQASFQEPSTITTLTAAIAHEINNPLAVISTVLQMLPPRSAIGDALQAVERIRTTIGDLNLYARGHLGSQRTLQVEQVMVAAFAQVHDLDNRATIVSRLEDTRAVRGNATALGRVFVELLENALDAIAGTPDAEIQVATYSDNGAWSMVEISDSGSGIPQTIQPHVFDPFFTTRGVGRRGLGLAVCRGIVEGMGGSITIHSSEGVGTRVVLAFPVTYRARSPRVTIVEGPDEGSTKRGRVLIVDDEVLFAKALSRLLSIDHDITIAANGRIALDLIERGERFDVILCDVMMPEMTGIELRAALLETAPDQAAQMIFVTGGTLDSHTEQLLGGVESFEKPCDVSQLRDAVRRRLGK